MIRGDAVIRERMSSFVDSGRAAHLEPILRAALDGKTALLLVLQEAVPFRMPDRRPFIAIIGDDVQTSFGPGFFHQYSLRRVIQACHVISVISCKPPPQIYGAAPIGAEIGLNTLIIETRPEHEIEWIERIKQTNPRVSLLIAGVKGGHA